MIKTPARQAHLLLGADSIEAHSGAELHNLATTKGLLVGTGAITDKSDFTVADSVVAVMDKMQKDGGNMDDLSVQIHHPDALASAVDVDLSMLATGSLVVYFRERDDS